MAPKTRVETRLNPENLQKVEQLVEDNDWDNRSQFIREAVRNQLQAHEGDEA